jgi:hypothetical protein
MALVSPIVLSLLLAATGGTTTSQFGFVSAISFSRGGGFAGLPRYQQGSLSTSTLFGMRGGGLFGGKNDAADATSAAATATAET